jgi:hypothetical protein
VNDFHSTPGPLSASRLFGQHQFHHPLGIIGVVSLVVDKAIHLRLDQLTHGWHDLLFVLLAGSFSIDLILELIRSTAAGLHNTRQRLEPAWAAIFELAMAAAALLVVLLPPKWRPGSRN